MFSDFFRKWGGIVVAAGKNWSASQAFIYSAALAFYTVFSIAPMVIVVVTVVGLILGERAAREELMGMLQEAMGPEAAEIVQTAVENAQVDQGGLWPTLIGIAATIVGATTVFAQMQQSLNRIWDVAPRPSRSGLWIFIKARILSLTVVLAVGFILLVSLLLSVAMQAIMSFASQWLPLPPGSMMAVELLISLLVVTLLFAAIFKILPDVILEWRDVLLGALITAVLFTLGRVLIAIYLANAAPASAYGAAGSLVLLLLWVNYSALILLFGAAFTRAHVEARGGRIRTRNTAVRMHHEMVEESA
jgi:membrane protein